MSASTQDVDEYVCALSRCTDILFQLFESGHIPGSMLVDTIAALSAAELAKDVVESGFVSTLGKMGITAKVRGGKLQLKIDEELDEMVEAVRTQSKHVQDTSSQLVGQMLHNMKTDNK